MAVKVEEQVEVVQKAEDNTVDDSKIDAETDTASVIGTDSGVNAKTGVACDADDEAQIGIEIEIENEAMEYMNSGIVA